MTPRSTRKVRTLAAMLAACLLAVFPGPSAAHSVHEVHSVCPLCDTAFTTLMNRSGTVLVHGLDGRPADQPFSARLPVCPSCRFVLYADAFDERDLRKCRRVVARESYQRHRDRGSYYLLAVLDQHLGVDDRTLADDYLHASWEETGEHRIEDQQRSLLHLDAWLAREPMFSAAWIAGQLVAGDLERRLGWFDRARERLATLLILPTRHPHRAAEVTTFQLAQIGCNDREEHFHSCLDVHDAPKECPEGRYDPVPPVPLRDWDEPNPGDLPIQAWADWIAIEAQLRQGGEQAVPQALAFLRAHDLATAIGREEVPVSLPYVARVRHWLQRHHQGVDVGLPMVTVDGGGFTLGSAAWDPLAEPDETAHEVVLTGSFAISAVEVTQELYQAVMGNNPSRFAGPQCPVEQVSWYDAVRFCNQLSHIEGLTPAYRVRAHRVVWDRDADGYRLPTEAEWEVAARAGADHAYAGSDDPDEVGWTSENGGDQTHEVGTLSPNALGLYDMTGNVWEWVWDGYAPYPSGPVTDPTGDERSTTRVCRSGSWHLNHVFARVSARMATPPQTRDNPSLGFRVARSEKGSDVDD